MQAHQSVNIRRISQNRAEQVGYYRFLENERVTTSELVRSLADACEQQVEGKHILAISDSSEINLQAHVGRIQPAGIGVVGNNRDLGFFIHPTLGVDAENGFPLGISDVQRWRRELGHANKQERRYSTLPIEEKESYKWLKAARTSSRYFERGGARLVTHIGDRESDLYEEWASIPDAFNHLLLRVRQDRRLWGQSQSLYAYLAAQPCAGTYAFAVPADPRHGRVAREAWMTVRFARVEIQRPDQLPAQAYPERVRLWAVEALEVSPPTGQEPIHWRLMTTHEVNSLEQALQMIQWYRWRWRIEQLFATLKTAGLDLEATQLESIDAIERLCILGLSVAVRLLQLLEGRDDPALPASVAFTEPQQQCLEQLAPRLNGRTRKQQNPYPAASLPWATWYIARLGGWSGYASQHPPGIATLTHGMRQFDAIFLGWQLVHTPLVCTQ
jgi:hypothetical protein